MAVLVAKVEVESHPVAIVRPLGHGHASPVQPPLKSHPCRSANLLHRNAYRQITPGPGLISVSLRQPSVCQQAKQRSNSLYRDPPSDEDAPDEKKIFIGYVEPFGYHPKGMLSRSA